MSESLSNQDRAAFAVAALRAYANAKGETFEDAVDQIVDLTADLMHFAAACNMDLDYLRRVSLMHFTEEQNQ